MSKAFTREDDSEEAPVRPRPVSLLPPGVRNYLTAAGARRFRDELARLSGTERPALAAAATGTSLAAQDAKEQLQSVESRMAQLEQCLATAEVVAPPLPPYDVVRFGAAVTVRDPAGAETTYRIVGADEADADKNEVSWLSPIARALLNARLGHKVPFKFPSGAVQLEIIGIAYG
ncbi:MAG: GreA/GreB family elongation factor [Opitutales bacterium]